MGKTLERLMHWLLHAEDSMEEAPQKAIEKTQINTARQREIQAAMDDWKAAVAYFENVTDPALIDYAVYDMEAARKRYIFLLRHADKREAPPLCQ